MRGLVGRLLLNPVLLLIVGGLALFLGVILLGLGAQGWRELAALEATRAVLDAAPGEPAFAEGRISTATTPVLGQFAAYLREQRGTCGRNTSCWLELERQTPPLIIDSAMARLQVGNSNYEMQTTDTEVAEAEATWTEGGIRVRGFSIGDPVFAIGMRDTGANTMQASLIYAGTRETVAAELRDLRRLAGGSGLVLAAFGLLCLRTGLRRFRRDLAAEKGPAEKGPAPF